MPADSSAPTGEPEITRDELLQLGVVWERHQQPTNNALELLKLENILLGAYPLLLAAALRDVEARERVQATDYDS